MSPYVIIAFAFSVLFGITAMVSNNETTTKAATAVCIFLAVMGFIAVIF